MGICKERGKAIIPFKQPSPLYSIPYVGYSYSFWSRRIFITVITTATIKPCPGPVQPNAQLTTYFHWAHFNIILVSMPRFHEWSLLMRFSNRNFVFLFPPFTVGLHNLTISSVLIWSP
jgi:hypothetical protein